MDKKFKGAVVLFRSPKEGEEDMYEKTLIAAGFKPSSVPVLDFSFINLDKLQDCLMRSSNYSGIILTSPRAVEACSRALELDSSETHRTDFLDLACYCVGPATKQCANQAGFKAVGHETGNADKLAKYIIENNAQNNTKPFLYPCGNLRRDTLSVKLKTEGFVLEEIVVYETIRSKTIEGNMRKLTALHGTPKYVVYFSPSGVQYTTDLYDSDIMKLKETKIVAIGSTTEAELKERRMTVAAVATTPDHTGVTEALLKVSLET